MHKDSITWKQSSLINQIINSFDFTIHAHGLAELGTAWREENVTIPHNKLYLVLDGSGEVQVNGRTIILKKNNAYLFPLNRSYTYRCDRRLKKFFIHFNFSLFSGTDIFELFEIKKFSMPLPSELFNAVHKFKFNHISDVITLRNELLQLISSFIGRQIPEKEEILRRDTRYESVLKYIDTHLSAKLSLRELAAQMHCAPPYFSARFKKDFKQNVSDFIHTRLVTRASTLLIYSDKKIKEISEELKFNNEFYFSRFIKKHTGATPRLFRNERRKILHRNM